MGARNNTRIMNREQKSLLPLGHYLQTVTRARILVVRPRTRSTFVLGRTYAHAKTTRTDVGRSPRAIDTSVRVGEPRSHAPIILSWRTSSARKARSLLARTYLALLTLQQEGWPGGVGRREYFLTLSLDDLPPSLFLSLSALVWAVAQRFLFPTLWRVSVYYWTLD